MRKTLTLTAVALLAAALTACTSSTASQSGEILNTNPPTAPPAVAAAPAPPACDITAWEAASPGTTAVVSDLAAIGKAAGAGDTLGAAADGHQLAQDAIAAETPLPPRCAPELRHAWKMMNVWYGLAGLAIYITGARPDLASHNYALAGRDVKRALRQWDIVQAQETALGG